MEIRIVQGQVSMGTVLFDNLVKQVVKKNRPH